MLSLLKRAAFEMRMFVASDPQWGLLHEVFIAYGQVKILRRGQISPHEARVGPDTELVIDGCQGSANTFATVAIKYAQSQPVKLAHHLHAPVQVIRGVHLGLPTIITVREPKAAALSLVRRWPSISATQALRWYTKYYRELTPFTDHFVISPFCLTTQGLDLVIEEVNGRFGTKFAPFYHTPEAVAAVRGPQVEAKRARAASAKKKKAHEFETAHARTLLDEADSVYHAFLLARG